MRSDCRRRNNAPRIHIQKEFKPGAHYSSIIHTLYNNKKIYIVDGRGR